jgi:hypothetical protein
MDQQPVSQISRLSNTDRVMTDCPSGTGSDITSQTAYRNMTRQKAQVKTPTCMLNIKLRINTMNEKF